MGIFSGLDREAYDRQYTDGELMRRIAGYFKPYGRRMLIIFAMVGAVALTGAGQPLIVAEVVGSLSESPSALVINLLVLGLLVLGVGVWAASWLQRRLAARVIGDVVSALRHDAYAASMRHDMAFFDEFQSGRIISRITTDTQEFAQVVQLIAQIVSQMLLVVVLVFVLVTISWQLTLLLLVLMPLVFVFTVLFRRLARFVTRKGFQVIARVNAAIQEAVTGISIAKSFRQESTIYSSFDEVNQKAYRVNLGRGFVLATVFPSLNVLAGFGFAALLYWGGLSAAAGAVSVGAWYLFMLSVDKFWFPMINLSVFWSQIQGGLSASERIFALIDAEPLVQQTDHQTPPVLKGDIRFEDVNFRYSAQEKVLEGFNLHIKPGEMVALVGHTGAGKSSIVKLITRFYEFQGGRILIDGENIRSFDLDAYRRQLGIVSQSPFLFAGTVADNIRYARPDMSDADIAAVAQRIGNGEWLETLPEGLQTDVGERGARLSMGQRQLVALTRVLVQQPAIFILDEATASVDPFTEAQIQEAMNLVLSQSTSIVIAHRLSTVRTADRILVLQQGQIIEEGSHDQLMDQDGHYAELYNTYFRHQSLEYVEQAGERRKNLAVAAD